MKFLKKITIAFGIIFLLLIFIFLIKIYYNGIYPKITGLATKSGTLKLCINQPPFIDFSKCNTKTTVNKVYTCDVDVNDSDTNIVFSDNSSLFDINDTTGIFSFKPKKEGIYLFEIKAFDGSNCSNNQDTKIFNLSVLSESDKIIQEEEKKGFINRDSSSGDSEEVVKDIDLISEISVLIKGDNQTHVVLKLVNTGTVPLINVDFEAYSIDGIKVKLNPNNYSIINPNEEKDLTLIFESEASEGNYDIFLFIETEEEFNKHFIINVDLKKGTAVLSEGKERFMNNNLSGNLKYEYNFYDWVVVLMMSTLLFFIITKLIMI